MKALVVVLCGAIIDPALIFTVLPVFLLLAFPKYRSLCLIVFNNLFLFMFVRGAILQPRWGTPLEGNYSFHSLVFGFITSRILLYLLLQNRDRLLKIVRIDLLIFLIPLPLYWLFRSGQNPYFGAFFVYFMASFFYFLFMWFDYQNKFNVANFLKSLNPFWQMRFFIPIPANLSLVPDRYSDIDHVQNQGLKMLYWLLPMSAAIIGFSHLTSFSPLLENLGKSWLSGGTLYKQESLLSTSEMWIFLVFGFLLNFFTIWAIYGSQVAIARMAGFHLESVVQNPFKAKSFYDFYARINVYYTQLLVELFVLPFNRWLIRLIPPKKSLGWSFFLGIFFGGSYFHLFGSWRISADFTQTTWDYLLICFPYFLSIGVIVGLTMHYRNWGKWPVWLRIPGYFLTAMIIALMFRQYLTAKPFWGVSLIGRLFQFEF